MEINRKAIYDPTPLYLRKRYLLFILAFLGHVNLHTMKVDFSVAIYALKENYTVQRSEQATEMGRNNNWSPNQSALHVSLYVYGFVATQLLGGYVASKLNGRLVFGMGVLGSALMTFLTPLLFYQGISYVYVLRIIIGICAGISYPSLYAVYDKWCPPSERSRVGSFGISGVYIGRMIGLSFTDLIIDHYNWEWVFYGFGMAASIWVVIWFTVTRESPAHDKWITNSEKEFILDSLNHYEFEDQKKIPWCAISTSMPVYAIAVAYFAYSWAYHTTFTVFPHYIVQVLELDIPTKGWKRSIPYVFVSILLFPSGYFADWLIIKNYLSTSQVRKFFNNISFFGQMIFLLMSGYFKNWIQIFICLSLSIGIGAFSMSGFLANTLDIAPQYSSIILGFANSFASLAELIAPFVEEYAVQPTTNADYKLIILITCGIFLFAIFFYGIFASGKVQPWVKKIKNTNSNLSQSKDPKIEK